LITFPQAVVLAAEAPATLRQLHAHFLHTPASVTWYAALILDLPWTCSAHARDIWTAPDWDKRQKLAALEWLVTCTGHGCSHLQDLCDIPRKVDLVYHGLDFARFPVPEQRRADRDGTDACDPAILLSVGRAVQKKGYHFLLKALAELPGDLHWRFRHIGYGPILAELQRHALELGIADRVDWLGAMSQDQVIEHYRQADLFVLANCVAEDGDMDGLPNVLMEAQSQKLACISTRLSGIPELIVDGETGLLVPPEDPAALSAAVARLCREPQRRARLSIKGFERLHTLFSHQDGIDRLADKFGLSPEPRRNNA
jgi:glycosyltransferase involved in cell wall biosynthesis